MCEWNDRGHITFLKGGEKWILLDQASLLSDVNGVLFAPEGFKQYCNLASATGVVPVSRLAQRFPKLDPIKAFHRSLSANPSKVMIYRKQMFMIVIKPPKLGWPPKCCLDVFTHATVVVSAIQSYSTSTLHVLVSNLTWVQENGSESGGMRHEEKQHMGIVTIGTGALILRYCTFN